jgi:hypothetical protein
VLRREGWRRGSASRRTWPTAPLEVRCRARQMGARTSRCGGVGRAVGRGLGAGWARAGRGLGAAPLFCRSRLAASASEGARGHARLPPARKSGHAVAGALGCPACPLCWAAASCPAGGSLQAGRLRPDGLRLARRRAGTRCLRLLNAGRLRPDGLRLARRRAGVRCRRSRLGCRRHENSPCPTCKTLAWLRDPRGRQPGESASRAHRLPWWHFPCARGSARIFLALPLLWPRL